ncbi:hypothetical protein OROMI_008939 [Orobanche minor]
MVAGLINANPIVYDKKEPRTRTAPGDVDEYAVAPIDRLKIFDILLMIFSCTQTCCFMRYIYLIEIICNKILAKRRMLTIRDIEDPEHPSSLEELKVVSEDAIEVDDKSHVSVTFTPTNEHCGMTTVDIRVAPGTHVSEAAVNKQLNDKERVAAALENPYLVDRVEECLAPSFR